MLPFQECSQQPNSLCLDLIGQNTVIDYCHLQDCLRNVVYVAGHTTAFDQNPSAHDKEEDGGGFWVDEQQFASWLENTVIVS